MSISLNPLISTLRAENSAFYSHKAELDAHKHHHELLVHFHNEVQSELQQNDQIDWENHPENRALIDEIFSLELVAGLEEDVYSFTDSEALMQLIQNVQASIKQKQQQVQENSQLSMSRRQELMQFYSTLLEIISKISNTVQNTLQRIH